jgi:hypothetical protein
MGEVGWRSGDVTSRNRTSADLPLPRSQPGAGLPALGFQSVGEPVIALATHSRRLRHEAVAPVMAMAMAMVMGLAVDRYQRRS